GARRRPRRGDPVAGTQITNPAKRILDSRLRGNERPLQPTSVNTNSRQTMNQWNKYAATTARKHGKPGREFRPHTTPIAIHSHLAIPQATAFVKPHLDMTTIHLAHF